MYNILPCQSIEIEVVSQGVSDYHLGTDDIGSGKDGFNFTSSQIITPAHSVHFSSHIVRS